MTANAPIALYGPPPPDDLETPIEVVDPATSVAEQWRLVWLMSGGPLGAWSDDQDARLQKLARHLDGKVTSGEIPALDPPGPTRAQYEHHRQRRAARILLHRATEKRGVLWRPTGAASPWNPIGPGSVPALRTINAATLYAWGQERGGPAGWVVVECGPDGAPDRPGPGGVAVWIEPDGTTHYRDR